MTQLFKVIQRTCCEQLYILSMELTLKRYCCTERRVHLLMDERLMLMTAWDVNINGALLG